jgi:hypothetical protein
VTKNNSADLKVHLQLSLAMAEVVCAEDVGLSELLTESMREE